MKTTFKSMIFCLLLIIISCSKDDGPSGTEEDPIQMEENTPPVMSNQSFTVDEDITAAIEIGAVDATDPDDDNLAFSITTNDDGLFEISETGELSLAVNQSLDFETAENHSITVAVTDGDATTSAEISIIVTDIDENSVPIIEDQSFTVTEDITDITIIGTVVASDLNDDALVFSISANDNDLFELTEAGELSLAANQSLDFETAANHSIMVAVTDGVETAMAEISIVVTNELENTAPIIEDQTFIVLENITDNRAIGTVVASDEEDDNLVFSISVNDNDLFEISEIGVLSLDDLQSLDFNTAQNHTITVAVSDGSATSEAQITIDVTELDSSAFITSWETTASNEIVTIPTRATEFNYVYTIDWGDGTVQNSVRGDAVHSYTTPGTYTVIINGSFSAIVLGVNTTSARQLRSVEQWGDEQWTTMKDAFEGTNNFSINATDAPDLSRVESMEGMFRRSSVNQDIGDWNMSNVTNMLGMFQTSSFNQDIGGWDVSNVTNMRAMFNQSLFNQDIGGWNVSNVTDMSFMFSDSSFNQDIGDWNVSNVTDMSFMFVNSLFNQDIGDWNVSNVTNMRAMFSDSQFNQDIGAWNVSSVINMHFMFQNNTSFNQILKSWNVSNVRTMERMFRGTIFEQEISEWDVSSVTNMESMFENSLFNLSIKTWGVDNVTNCTNFALNAAIEEENRPIFTNCDPK